MIGPDTIRRLAETHFPKALHVRRHLHEFPELSFNEFKTSEFIQQQLTSAGVAFKNGYVKTGIMATIEGKNPSKGTVLLRADMDALPIVEKNEVTYKSRHEGIMHACGHDVHSACALGAALILNDLRHEWEGTVRIMFQPGEEVLPGGASLMIGEGALDEPRVDKAIALHVYPAMETGRVGFKEGMYMASTDELYLTVNGRGGHAAMPAEYVNPLLIAADMLLEINRQFMVAGALADTPGHNIPTVVAFGKIMGMGATNVIPDQVTVEGTFRTMDEAWRKQVHERLQHIVKMVSAKYNITSALRIEKGYPFLVNDVDLTRTCAGAARQYLSNDRVEELPLRMTAEDFAFISQKVPSCFFRLGTGNSQKGIRSGVHTPTFDIDEAAIETGMGVMAWLAINALNA